MLQKLRPLFPYMWRYRRGYLAGALCVVCSNAIWVFFPLVIRNAVNDLTQHLTRRGILEAALLLTVLAVSKGIFLFLTRWILIGISRDIEYDLRNDLLLSLERQSMAYFQRNRTGDIMPRSPTMVAKPCGNSSTSSRMEAMLAASRISSSVARGRPKAMFSRIVSLKRKVSCGTKPMAWRKSSKR